MEVGHKDIQINDQSRSLQCTANVQDSKFKNQISEITSVAEQQIIFHAIGYFTPPN